MTSKAILLTYKVSAPETNVTGERGDAHLAGRRKVTSGMLLAERRKSHNMISVVTIVVATATKSDQLTP